MSKDKKEFIMRILFALAYLTMWYYIPFISMGIHYFAGIICIFIGYTCFEEWIIEKWEKK